ncbi:GAF domain-containing protein [Bacillus sp. CGMCC 1.16607]|uniref:GAF domain-containing protein n=1 Tax=Bacillus sp. CGMCC 1.16607 TaxID=3351842 RepID=UPI0036337233
MSELNECPDAVQTCSQLLMEMKADFVGLAIQNETGPDVRWRYATGNLNDKYKRITVRYGKGIAGKVISSGSSMMITSFPQQITGKTTDYPIMLAEKLVSSYAVPLFFNGVPKGVLLVGHRTEYMLSNEEQQVIKKAALFLEEAIKIHNSL